MSCGEECYGSVQQEFAHNHILFHESASRDHYSQTQKLSLPKVVSIVSLTLSKKVYIKCHRCLPIQQLKSYYKIKQHVICFVDVPGGEIFFQ